MKDTINTSRGGKRTAYDETEARKRLKTTKAAYYRSMREAARLFDEHAGITVAGRQVVTREDSVRTLDHRDARDCISAKELEGIESAGSLTVINDDMKHKMFQRIKPCFSLQSWERKTCAVCDCSWPAKDVKRCELRPSAMKRWALKLRHSKDVPTEHRNLYDVSRWFPGLKGALLSQRGVEQSEAGGHSGLLHVCNSCFTSLSSSSQKPPKFAIANGFDIGILPSSLQDANVVEKRMTSMTSLASSITIMQGGRHKCLKGHVTVVTLDPSAISVRLPQLLDEGTESFLVILSGKLTSPQKLLAMRRYRARRSVVKGLLNFYIANNVLYQRHGVQLSEEVMLQFWEGKGLPGVVIEDVNDNSEPDITTRSYFLYFLIFSTVQHEN